MSGPYSYDLRQKALGASLRQRQERTQQRFAIAAVEPGEGKSNVSRMFNISRNPPDL